MSLALFLGCEDPTGPEGRVERMFIEPDMGALLVADTLRLTAVGLANGGDTVRNASYAWTSDNPEVASVDGTGLVRGEGAGTTWIKASPSGITAAVAASVEIRVYSRPPVEECSAYFTGTLPLPDGGTLRPDTATVLPALSVSLRALANDGGTDLTISEVSPPAVGGTSNEGAWIHYTPPDALPAFDAFWYYVDSSTRSFVCVRIPGRRSPPSYDVAFLGTLGGPDGEAVDVNSSGHATGWAVDSEGDTLAFLWDGATMMPLTVPDGRPTWAVALNDHDVVAGVVGGGRFGGAATLWESGTGREIDLGGARPTGINDAGVVVGGPYRWEAGALTQADPGNAYLEGINDDGWIVGERPSLYGVPVLIDPDGNVSELPGFPEPYYRGSHTSGVITDRILAWPASFLVGGSGEAGQVSGVWLDRVVNAIGVVTAANDDAYILVGDTLFLDGERHAVADLLTDDAVELLSLNAIGDEGHIVGRGRLRTSGETGAILLTPRF